jgi:hypothetical protein
MRAVYANAPLIYGNIRYVEGLSFSARHMQRERTMKRTLIGIISMGIFAVGVGAESASAQTYGPYGYSRAYSSRAYVPQNRSAVRRSAPRNAPLYANPDSPAASGGGSLGYNQNLWNW